MSTGRRIAKRSILGTRVAVCRLDGLYYTGVICSAKTGDGTCGPRYSIRFDGSRYVAEFGPNDMVGPGFRSVTDIDILPGQSIHITHNGRDTEGVVRRCRPEMDQVWVEITQGGSRLEVKRRLDEVRLWESRKSPRLADSDTDFARLADVGVDRRRSPGVDIPPSGAHSSRKRRSSPSPTLPFGQGQGHKVGEMTECTAAMVLMSLSASPKSPKFSYDSGPSWSDQMSIGSSGSETPSPPLSDVPGVVGSVDEGIYMEEEADDRRPQVGKQTVFQCTWPGCRMITSTCSSIEKHVRNVHLGPSEGESDLSDHEEEFYYTELEVAPPEPTISSCVPLEAAALESVGFSGSSSNGSNGSSSGDGGLLTSSPPTLSHMDMARPPHEDPQYQRELARRGLVTGFAGAGAAAGAAAGAGAGAGGVAIVSGATPIPIPQRQSWTQHLWSSGLPGKYVRIGTKVITTSPKASPHHRRVRGDVKKCRKVYGMEHREMWCTQCKWKKACTRFSGLMD